MALKDITTIEETEQLSADATFYTEDGGLFRRSGVDAVKDALGLALESTATKQALLNCFQHVAWIDENGQDYYDALYDALYNIPVSITATFVQGDAVIYNTDPLSVLRQYLVVRATYEDETVQTVTAYTLSGNLTVGTSTITVAYKGRSATFEVEVTQAESYITAVYTPGTGTVYTDDPLDSLKDNLVVTYYANQDAQGVTAPAADYTLSGTLTAGTSTVLVDYNGNTTTFTVEDVIDWYNQNVWSLGIGNIEKVVGTADTNQSNTTMYPSRTFYRADYTPRRSYPTTRGLLPYNVYNQTAVSSDYYPIPVPANANHIKISMTPGQYIFVHFIPYDEETNSYDNSTTTNRITWTDMSSGYEGALARDNDKPLFMIINSKYDSAGSSYPVEPTELVIEFSEV